MTQGHTSMSETWCSDCGANTPAPWAAIEQIREALWMPRSMTTGDTHPAHTSALAALGLITDLANTAAPFAEPYDTDLAQYEALRAAIERVRTGQTP